MERYEMPDIEIINFYVEDSITASGTEEGEPDIGLD